MNTDVLIIAPPGTGPALLDRARRMFDELEARFSRFRPESELSRFNARDADRVRVSPQMFELLQLALDVHRRTGGIFEPAVLSDLVHAGYDRSFELVARDAPANEPDAVPAASIRDLVLDAERCECAAPPGLRLDFGGIAKGFAVDLAARAMSPARDVLIDAGGDIRAMGDGPAGDGWPVGVWDPHGGPDLDVVTLRDQAIATSTTAIRRWRRGGRWMHHIIDPRTGCPAASAIVSASVIAATATEADVYAKCALIVGREDATAFLRARGAEGLFVLEDRTIAVTPGWPGRERTDTQEAARSCRED